MKTNNELRYADKLIWWNVRIWKIHFQITRVWKIEPMFAWFDLWIGLFVDQKKELTWYFFPVPMFGFKVSGIGFRWNPHYKLMRDPFIWVFQTPHRYNPDYSKD